MATNPLYSTAESPNNATAPSKAVNQQGVYVPRTHNEFDNSYFHYLTQKFGVYHPFWIMEGVPRDTIAFANSHEVRSLPMSSPFLSTLTLNKDFFMVTNDAIQPNTWDYIYTPKSQGDDVPEDAHNVLPYFGSTDVEEDSFLQYLFVALDDAISAKDYVSSVWILLMIEHFCSSGSLLYNLGYKFNPLITNDYYRGLELEYVSFDKMFNDFFLNSVLRFSINTDNFSGTFCTTSSESATGDQIISMYEALSLLRNYGSSCEIISASFDLSDWSNLAITGLPTWDSNTRQLNLINMDRICAYQLACAQFFVNPSVDYIYNAQLFRDNWFTLLRDGESKINSLSLQAGFFTMNGISVPYDYFSEYYYQVFRNHLISSRSIIGNQSALASVYDEVHYLFGYREALRFGDYFTDSRTRPLAEGDNYTEVSDRGVDVIDMSRNIILQRFRNAVVKLGNSMSDYLQKIMGADPTPDYHVPKYIIHQDFVVQGNEVANTTQQSQGQLVTNLRSVNDQYVFQVDIDRPCVLIGISSFSVPRVYSQTKDRQFFHSDRYDMFNPMLQAYGDQPVYNRERTDLRPNNEIFGYQSRNNEYKQRYSVASGSFANSLPAWAFVTDSLYNPVRDLVVANTQSPEFIRAHDYEFNRFFAAMPGLSLGSGFHFIMVYNNKCNAIRPMEINPSTL